MDTMEITFGDEASEVFARQLKDGQVVSAAALLTAMDTLDETAAEEFLIRLRQRGILPDLSDLPRYSADANAAVRLRREQQLAQQGDLRSQLEADDPLALYLEELAGIPAQGDPAVLAQQLVDDPTDEPTLTALMNLFLSRVVEIAREYTGNGVLLLDLIQEGSMGLWEGLADYRGEEITAFCDQWIRWAMTKAVLLQAHTAGVGQRLRQMLEDYRSVDEKLLAELGRNPTIDEIAEGLHIDVQEAETAARMLENARLLQKVKKPEPDQLPQEEDQAVEDTAYFQMRQRISELLSGLSPEDAKLLTLRYGLEGGLPLDPQQTGNRLGLTPEEVVARESAALAQLRNQ